MGNASATFTQLSTYTQTRPRKATHTASLLLTTLQYGSGQLAHVNSASAAVDQTIDRHGHSSDKRILGTSLSIAYNLRDGVCAIQEGAKGRCWQPPTSAAGQAIIIIRPSTLHCQQIKAGYPHILIAQRHCERCTRLSRFVNVTSRGVQDKLFSVTAGWRRSQCSIRKQVCSTSAQTHCLSRGQRALMPKAVFTIMSCLALVLMQTPQSQHVVSDALDIIQVCHRMGKL